MPGEEVLNVSAGAEDFGEKKKDTKKIRNNKNIRHKVQLRYEKMRATLDGG